MYNFYYFTIQKIIVCLIGTHPSAVIYYKIAYKIFQLKCEINKPVQNKARNYQSILEKYFHIENLLNVKL